MRLIDADALDVIGYTGTDGRPNTFDAGVIWTLEKIDAMPTIDAVPVVRCRECRHYKPSKVNSSTKHYCGVIDGFPKEHWFCADGQRREDGDAT